MFRKPGCLRGFPSKHSGFQAWTQADLQRRSILSSSHAYWALTSQGVLLTERTFEEYSKDQCRRVVLMPMVHLAARNFFEATLRHERFSSFHYVFHEGTSSKTGESVDSRWRFIRGLRGASLSALLMEFSWIFFFRGPLAVSNNVCWALGWQPLVLQPDPLLFGSAPARNCRVKDCRENDINVNPNLKDEQNPCENTKDHSENIDHDIYRKPRFVDTDSTSIVEILTSMITLGRHDLRAQRTIDTLLNFPVDPNSTLVVPWGVAHMPYFDQQLRQNGFREVQEAVRIHVAISWGSIVSFHIFVWFWWWAIHAVADAVLLWHREGRIAIRMPFYWLWGATLHIGGVARKKEEPMGIESLHPPEGALKDYWRL